MKTNTKAAPVVATHEGATSRVLSPEIELRRTVMACMLWEDSFYESGVSVADRIKALVAKCDKKAVAQMAVDARTKMKLRHVPLLLCRELARCKSLRADTLADVIQRPDELAEFVSIYWKEGRKPLPASAKRGLAKAFAKFEAGTLAKWNKDDRAVKLRDVLFLCHAKPKDDAQAEAWKKLIAGTLETPDTWEVALSAGADKKATFERLIGEGKLGALATLRNLRNMVDAKVPDETIRHAIRTMRTERVLPFRFVSAAQHARRFEPELEAGMFRCLAEMPRLSGRTILLVDVSGSMVGANVSAKSDIDRLDAASALAMMLREIGECDVYAFDNEVHEVPARRGFALRDLLRKIPHGGTRVGHAVAVANTRPHDRLIVLTDEQSQDQVGAPKGRGYMVNVGTYQNGVGYGQWTSISGWSEAVIDFIQACEAG